MKMRDNIPAWDVVDGLTPPAWPFCLALGDRSGKCIPRYGLAFKLKAMLFDQRCGREDRVLDCALEVASLIETLPLIPFRSRIAPPALRTHHAFPARERCLLLETRHVRVGKQRRWLERQRRDDSAGPLGTLVLPDRVVC